MTPSWINSRVIFSPWRLNSRFPAECGISDVTWVPDRPMLYVRVCIGAADAQQLMGCSFLLYGLKQTELVLGSISLLSNLAHVGKGQNGREPCA
jgi:hypothetical protein